MRRGESHAHTHPVGDTNHHVRLGLPWDSAMEALSPSKVWRLTWTALRLGWITLKILLNLVCVVVGIAVVLVSIAVMLVSIMRVFLPRT